MKGVIAPSIAWLVLKGENDAELLMSGKVAGYEVVACIATTGMHGDTKYSIEALEHMRDQINAEAKGELRSPAPAFKCENCGAEGYFIGKFSPSRYERQLEKWRENHKTCLPIVNGGMI